MLTPLNLFILGQATQSASNGPSTYVPGYAVGWGTLALINAGLAQAKNRSGLGWFVASLFLGPIATFAIVVLHRLPLPPPKTAT
jgi:hypothetical protein